MSARAPTYKLEDHAGDILQKARSGLGLSLSQAALSAGISQAELRQFERLESRPPDAILRPLAGLLGLSAKKLGDIADDRWSPLPPPPELKEQALIIQGSIGGYSVNGYILYDRESRAAACADTAYDPEAMLAALSRNRLELKYILLTHCHQDHMEGVEQIKERTGASILLHRRELPLFSSQSRIQPDGFVDEPDRLALGALEIGILCTPGHTPGGTTYVVRDPRGQKRPLCIVGDALFAGSTGRSMSPEGYRDLLDSLSRKVLSLAEETVILPGHGPLTTVGEEKRRNPFF